MKEIVDMFGLERKKAFLVEEDRQIRQEDRQEASVFVGFIGSACKKRRFLTVFVGFVELIGIAERCVGLIRIVSSNVEATV